MGEAKRRKKLDPNYGKRSRDRKVKNNFRHKGYYPEDYELFMETAKDCCSDLISQYSEVLEKQALESKGRGFILSEMSDFYEDLIETIKGQKKISSLSKVDFIFIDIDSLCKNLLPADRKNPASLPNRVCPILENYDLSKEFYILFNFSRASDFYDNDCYYFLSLPKSYPPKSQLLF